MSIARERAQMKELSTIGFDADDTLWQNEQFFRLTEARFAELLADHAEPDQPEDGQDDGKDGDHGGDLPSIVMAGLDPAIHVVDSRRASA